MKDELLSHYGPCYGVRLIDSLPVGGMIQAMPSRDDLITARRVSERTVAGYEVLLSHYHEAIKAIELAKQAYLGCGGRLTPSEVVDAMTKILNEVSP